MKTVVLCNRPDRLEKILKTTRPPLDFLCLQMPQEDHELCGKLGQVTYANELRLNQLVRSKTTEFRAKYIEFMGQLNLANHSRQWWAMPFTNKYPLASRLCRNLLHFQIIIDAYSACNGTLLVLTSNQELAGQLVRWAEGTNVLVINAIKSRFDPKNLTKQQNL